MYQRYYKLTAQPFGVTPDPRFLYLSPTHREAIASVCSGVMQNRGFTALVAHPGMGKTTLLFDLLERLPASIKSVFLFQTQCSERDLVRGILEDLGEQDTGKDLAAMQAQLNEVLLRETSQGKRVVVVIDEAQNLDDSVLEVLRVLSNFETGQEKLLHIVLAGQPQLAKKLASPGMVQLRQRVSVVARIAPFGAADVRAYIQHRLAIAGYSGVRPLFSDRAYDLIAVHSQGVPRNINNICFNAMSLACALGQTVIGPEVIREVLRDLDMRTLMEEGRAPEPVPMTVPAVHVPAARPALFRWVLASALVLGCLPLLEADRRVGRSNPDSTPLAVNGSPSDAPESRQGVLTTRIAPKDTLFGLCLRTVGHYDPQIVGEIEKLNPWLTNPKRLPVGMSIRIPTGKPQPAGKGDVSRAPGIEEKEHE